ncbi:reverse transcriptase domain-containing protein [Tanacetum coccineum]|uniref:Reverse transcriptase domain-containing protein n=1 Tax=Tanacetum coccineum TaxID=301880 RepID=A0ABQ5BK28_9ASTR
MVKKHDGTWRMCVDFKDLNNACPKDCYPLPEIDWKVESLCGYSFKCFLDAYKGYHQIKMAKEDEEKTAFITSQGIFCYSKMPFGLKNVGSTYQRLVDKAFQKQIGRNLEVYVDDLVIKSRTEEEVIRDITETFKTLRQINMKLNPKKCTFGMQEGMFLGYKVSTNGLRACPEKADAFLSVPSPRCIKDSDFQWTPEAEEAFPTLITPKENEELIIYLAAAKEVISVVLMTDREGRQTPVYFVNRTLRGPEVNYTPMEKLVLALLSASKRLKRYFQAHTVVVITNQPMKQLLSSSEISRRMLKWKIELEGYDIQYRPRTVIKGQILADGSSCVDGSGAGLILTNPEGAEFTYAMRFRFDATNNEAEYEVAYKCCIDSMSKLREMFQTWLQQRQAQVVNLDTYTPELSQCRKILICYDDDDDELIYLLEEFAGELALIAPIPPGIVEADFDPKGDIRFIENLMYDNSFPRPPETLKDDSETVIDSNNDYSSSDNDSLYSDDIDYVEGHSPPILSVSLDGDDILREKLLNVNLLIAKIEALKDNPTPSSDFVTKSSSTSLNFFLEETNTFDNSLPESETFCFNLEEISSGSPTSYLDLSLPDYEAFFCDSEPDSGNFTMDVVEDIFDNPTREPRVHVPNVLPTHPTLQLDSDFTLSSDSLGSDLVVSFPSGTRNKIFDPGIFIEVQSKRFLSPNEFSISFIRDPLSPVIARILKTRARSFVLRSLELHILSFILGIQYPNLID